MDVFNHLGTDSTTLLRILECQIDEEVKFAAAAVVVVVVVAVVVAAAACQPVSPRI